MCTWSKWFAVAEPRSDMARHPSAARSGVQMRCAQMIVRMWRAPALARATHLLIVVGDRAVLRDSVGDQVLAALGG